MPADADTLLSVREAAERLGISRQHVHQLIRAGLLPSTRIGTRRIVRASDVDAPAVQQRKRKPGPVPRQ